MKMSRAFLVLLSVMLITITGCISVSKNPVAIDASARPMENRTFEVGEEAKGVSSSFKLFWFIPVTKKASLDTAIDRALAPTGADNLVEMRAYQEREIWILGMIDLYRVEGVAVHYNDK